MHVYGTKDVERLTGISPAALRALMRAGHVKPGKGRGGRNAFSFQDLIVLRTAHELAVAKVPTRRIVSSLRELRAELPESLPLTGLSVTAVGDRVAVREGVQQRDMESGQYLLALNVQMHDSELRIFASPKAGEVMGAGSNEAVNPRDRQIAASGGEDDYESGCAFEEADDAAAALAAYERCLAVNADHDDARINCGRLLHLAGRLADAERMYREVKRSNATVLFNLAVLLEDLGRDPEAIDLYREALDADPSLADAHYNLACLHERMGNERDCLRHLMAYRRATRVAE